jgi:dTDP-4-dehydrorhamnose 3,5-epimerase
VTAGSVYDVVVDLRRDSPTFGKWEGFVLSAENKKQLFVPRGFAHGFLTLEEGTEFLYKCDDVYDAGHEGGLAWDDAILGIDWMRVMTEYGIEQLEISEKDRKNWGFKQVA